MSGILFKNFNQHSSNKAVAHSFTIYTDDKLELLLTCYSIKISHFLS